MKPRNELGVIALFALQAEKNGFEIVDIRSAFPDALIRKEKTMYRVEFEFEAARFIYHQHDVRECDLVICWENNLPDFPLPILVLSSPDWIHTPLRLPSKDARDAYYWKCRALRVEKEMQDIQKSWEKKTKATRKRKREMAKVAVPEALLIDTTQPEPQPRPRYSKLEAQNALLTCLIENPYASLSQLASKIYRSKATVHAYCLLLEASGHIRKNGDTWEVLMPSIEEPLDSTQINEKQLTRFMVVQPNQANDVSDEMKVLRLNSHVTEVTA